MSNFSSGNWFAERKKFNFQTFTIEGIDFDLIPLTDDLSVDVMDCETYESMLELAASSGISNGRDRIIDDEVMKSDIDTFWALGELDVDCDPSIRYQVGKEVCEISGLSVELQAMFDKEEQERVDALKEQGNVNGDGEIPDINIDQLNDDAINNAAA